ncbi:MAG: hypothetical protein GXP53_07595 [Deltaproteobacteria bacterium]|nr:hypothetical protein [Deltaproteobacteria bacterium]
MEKDDGYWDRWERLLEAASNLQGLFPGAVLIGGSAAAVYAKHRVSFDADHILPDLERNYEDIIEFLENRDDWKTARLNPPKLILGNFQGVETGIRQLRRDIPLETRAVTMGGKQLIVPTIQEMIRIKGWMIVCRNAVRDYIDFAALAGYLGTEDAVVALENFDNYYSDLIRNTEISPIIQLVRQLAEPHPYDLDDIDISQYRGVRPPLDSWEYIKSACESVSVELGDRL